MKVSPRSTGSTSRNTVQQSIKEKDAHDDDIRQLKSMYSKHLKTLKEDAEKNISALRTHEQSKERELDQEFKGKIAEDKNRNDKQRQVLEQDFDMAEHNNKTRILQNQENYNRKIDTLNKSFLQQFENTNDDFNDQVEHLHETKKDYMQEAKSQHHKEVVQDGVQRHKELGEIKQNFDSQYNQDERRFNQAIFQQRMQQDKLLKDEEKSHQKKIGDMREMHLKGHEDQIKKFHLLLNEAQKDFQVKYNNINTSTSKMLENLTQNNNLQIQNLKNQLATNKTSYQEKVSDPFYRILKISPTLREHPDHYRISIQLPAHEQDFVQVSGHMRQIVLTFNRGYNDEVLEVDGSLDKIGRQETLTKVMQVGSVVNARKIERTYENGFLNFMIPKA